MSTDALLAELQAQRAALADETSQAASELRRIQERAHEILGNMRAGNRDRIERYARAFAESAREAKERVLKLEKGKKKSHDSRRRRGIHRHSQTREKS